MDEMDPKPCAATIIKYRDIIVGVKTAHYWTGIARGMLSTCRGLPTIEPSNARR